MAATSGSTVKSELGLNLKFTHNKTVNSVPVGSTPSWVLNIVQQSGTVIDTQDELWWDNDRTLAASANESLDLAGGLTDAFGDTITFTKLKGLFIRNKNVVAGDTMRIGGVANHFPLFGDATSDYLTLGPGGILLITNPSLAGYTVTAGTGDLLYLAETGATNTVTFDIAIWGIGT